MTTTATTALLSDGTLSVHVVAGAVALVAGAAAICTTKGGRWHRTAGKLYVAGMAVVVVTAIPLAYHTGNTFLAAIAVFSGYLVFAGYRVLSRKRPTPEDARPVDVLGHGTMLLVGSGMVLGGTWNALTGPIGLEPVTVVFGVIGASLAGRELYELYRPPDEPRTWFFRHVAFMGGGYIATVTAAITVNLTVLPPVLRWLGPTIVGAPLIVYVSARYRSRFDAGTERPGARSTTR